MLKKPGLIMLSLFALLLLLSGCMDIATTGAQAIYNRHTLQKGLNDQFITLQAYQALNYKTKQFQDANISISTYNREVVLAGQVPQAWQKMKAEELIKTIPNVKEVYNTITVAGASSALTRISDAWLTTKIKSKLIASNDVDATQIKVMTENGTVYLMGIVPKEEALAAVDIATDTEGVQKVIKLFSYITISKNEDVLSPIKH